MVKSLLKISCARTSVSLVPVENHFILLILRFTIRRLYFLIRTWSRADFLCPASSGFASFSASASPRRGDHLLVVHAGKGGKNWSEIREERKETYTLTRGQT